MRVKRTVLKLLKLYVLWTAVYLPVTVFGFWIRGVEPLKAVVLFTRNFLLVGENFCSWPLWYLLASVVAFALVYLLLRRGMPAFAVLAASYAFLLLGFGVSVLMTVDGLPSAVASALRAYALAFVSVRNGLFEGFFYVALGMVLGTRNELVGSVRLPLVVAGCAVGYLGSVIVSSDAHLPFCGLFAVCAFLLSARKSGEGLAAHPFLRASSTVVYLVHMLIVVLVVYVVFEGTSATPLQNGVPSFGLFASTLAASFAVSVVAYKLAGRVPAFKWVFGI